MSEEERKRFFANNFARFFSGNMGFDYRIYDNAKDLKKWKDENGNYFPVYKSF